MRGKVRQFFQRYRLRRITPAYAGKSPTGFCGNTGRRDHPRVCGEKFLLSRNRYLSGGSPPRMRGKGQFIPVPFDRHRITPAYAGKSWGRNVRDIRQRDHPRVCGEKVRAVLRYATFVGSPPRMRGKGSGSLEICHIRGITPAYAGKRLRMEYRVLTLQDHPRVCGEKLLDALLHVLLWGSPPRMRGKD